MVLNGNRTSIALEPIFWSVADRQAAAAGIRWQEWARDRLEQAVGGRASALRVAILQAVCN